MSKKKWMQDAVNPKKKGELRKKMNVPVSKLKSEKKRLQEKGEGEKID